MSGVISWTSLLRCSPFDRLRANGLFQYFLPLVVALLFPLSAHAYPTFDEVKRDYAASDAVLLDRNGVALQTLRMDKKVLRLPWVALDDLSLAMRDILILAEDRHF